MPAAVVKSLAKKAGVSVDKAEGLWSKAKAAASAQGHKDEFDYITGVFKRMLGLKESTGNLVLEATVSSMIPTVSAPLSIVGPFTDEDRKLLVKRLQTIFPGATDEAIEQLVFGGKRKKLSEKGKV